MPTYTPRQLAELDLRGGFPRRTRLIAEAVGVEEAESGGDSDNESQGPEGHIGLWSLSPDFGSEAERLDPLRSTQLAEAQYEKTGWDAWAPYETEEAEGTGPSRAPKYMTIAEQAIAAARGQVADPKWPRSSADESHAGASSGGKTASSSGGASGPMKFLLTAALVLGGFGLVILGARRAVGQAHYAGAAA